VLRSGSNHWGSVAKFFHWTVVLLILVQGTIGLVMVELQVTFNRAGADGYSMRFIAGFAASAAFKRSTFGMTRSLPDNGDDVAIHIEVEGIRDGDAQKQAAPDDAEHQ